MQVPVLQILYLYVATTSGYQYLLDLHVDLDLASTWLLAGWLAGWAAAGGWVLQLYRRPVGVAAFWISPWQAAASRRGFQGRGAVENGRCGTSTATWRLAVDVRP